MNTGPFINMAMNSLNSTYEQILSIKNNGDILLKFSEKL